MFTDQVGEAVVIIITAENYFTCGQLDKAKSIFIKAAELLIEQSVKHNSSYERNCLRYTAGVQYYNAGEYVTAHQTLAAVNASLLPGEIHLNEILTTLRNKCSNGYMSMAKSDLAVAIKNKNWEMILTSLKENPYLLPQIDAMELRVVAYTQLGMKEYSDLFVKDLENLKSQAA
jgi:hypothetical protein